jgi:hypothetical protein
MASRLVTSLRKMDSTQRSLQSRTSLSHLKSWSPRIQTFQPLEPSLPRRRQPSEVPSIRTKGDDFDDEEKTTGGREDHVELAPMGSSLQFRSDSTATRRRQSRAPNQAIVGLERLGLIAPSTALDISRPMALTPARAPFSDIIPLDSSTPSPKLFTHLNRSKNGSNSERRAHRGGGAGAETGGGFGITVERETVVTVAAPS